MGDPKMKEFVVKLPIGLVTNKYTLPQKVQKWQIELAVNTSSKMTHDDFFSRIMLCLGEWQFNEKNPDELLLQMEKAIWGGLGSDAEFVKAIFLSEYVKNE